ncbi:GNAT family N-acetyltransferase [Bacillus spongiae]|uniref:GNAT family N-acetyltransferase n=1 Tax=Bacillus spongiae TaxID=2683610 RepID=A0ABU8HF28_9BACI
MSIQLRAINKYNWEECISLKLDEKQERYLPQNVYTLAESKFVEDMHIFGIYKGNLMVGFAAYVLDEDGDMNITRLMIDKSHQGMGYGKLALIEIIEQIKRDYENKEIWLSIHPENNHAIYLYKAAGFKVTETGLESSDEIFLKLDLNEYCFY